MVIFLIVLLAISIVGLISLLGARLYETTNGHIMFAAVRPTVGAWLGMAIHVVERVAPALVHSIAVRLYRRGSEFLHRTVAWAILHTERLLEQTLHVLRQTTAHTGGGEASAFLREVAEHKKQLQEKASEQGVIYEE